jgi:anti-sigma factor RsiW
MRTCGDIRELLGVWLDGELSPRDAEGVRLHLQNCTQCNSELRQLERLHSSLKSLIESNGPRVAFEPFWRGVQERIAEKKPWHRGAVEWARSTLAGPGLAWAIPAVILVVLSVVSLNSVWKLLGQRNNFAAVESIDAHGRNVALLREDETKTTVIWLYQNQEGEDDSSGENTETSPSF